VESLLYTSPRDGLYEAMGSIAAAAHANGETIDENIRPEDNLNVQHGFDIFRRSNVLLDCGL